MTVPGSAASLHHALGFHAGREDLGQVGFLASNAHPVSSSATRRGVFLRRYAYEFMHLLAPHLDRSRVARAANAPTQDDVDAVFANIEMPLFQ